MSLAGLRPACDDDEPFLVRLLEQTKAFEFSHLPSEIAPALIAQQRAAQRGALRAAGGEQILADERGTPIARLVVDERAGALHLVDLTVDAAARRRGIGTTLLAGVVERAAAAAQNITLQVDVGNAVARRLYERAGFVATHEDELAVHMLRRAT